jgi:hypothetical protein
MGFGKRNTANPAVVSYIPYWFLALATGLLAAACGKRWPRRFTLRSLFIATTFLAVVLGMIAWLDREVKRRTMFRHWRIQFSIICLALLAATLVMWWRSYHWFDAYQRLNGNPGFTNFISARGDVAMNVTTLPQAMVDKTPHPNLRHCPTTVRV